jgi:hypothetical protein
MKHKKILIWIMALIFAEAYVMAQVVNPPVGTRPILIPTVADRINQIAAQTGLTYDEVVTQVLNQRFDPQPAIDQANYDNIIGAANNAMLNQDHDGLQVMSDCATPYLPTTTTLEIPIPIEPTTTLPDTLPLETLPHTTLPKG